MTKARWSWLEVLSAWERERFTIPLQRLRALDSVSKLLEYTAMGEFILPLFACLYWCIDQYFCVAGIWLVPINEIANGLLKWATRRGRPCWESDRVRVSAWSNEYSFPSSHAQQAATISVFFYCSSTSEHAITRFPLWLALLYIALVAASRVQLGIHYASDVVVGATLGALTASTHAALLPAMIAFGEQSTAHRLLGLSAPLLIGTLAVLLSFAAVRSSSAADPPEWGKNAARGKYAGRALDPRGNALGSYTGMLGVLLGLLIGTATKHLTPLPYAESRAASLGRALVGNVVLMILFEGCSALTPRQPVWLYASLRCAKYVLVPTYILNFAPPLFGWLGL
jgi:hypothetical protein